MFFPHLVDTNVTYNEIEFRSEQFFVVFRAVYRVREEQMPVVVRTINDFFGHDFLVRAHVVTHLVVCVSEERTACKEQRFRARRDFVNALHVFQIETSEENAISSERIQSEFYRGTKIFRAYVFTLNFDKRDFFRRLDYFQILFVSTNAVIYRLIDIRLPVSDVER